jgi:hypothetical protein
MEEIITNANNTLDKLVNSIPPEIQEQIPQRLKDSFIRKRRRKPNPDIISKNLKYKRRRKIPLKTQVSSTITPVSISLPKNNINTTSKENTKRGKRISNYFPPVLDISPVPRTGSNIASTSNSNISNTRIIADSSSDEELIPEPKRHTRSMSRSEALGKRPMIYLPRANNSSDDDNNSDTKPSIKKHRFEPG